MELFEQTYDTAKNWLPYDGCVQYFGKVLTQAQADHFLEQLLQSNRY